MLYSLVYYYNKANNSIGKNEIYKILFIAI